MSNYEIDDLFITEPDKAFSLLYDQYYAMLCNVSYRITSDSVAAEDIVQEVILEVWKKRSSFSEKLFLIPYLKRAVYNRSLNWIKARKIDFAQEDEAQHIPDATASVVENMVEDEVKKKLNNAISALPDKCRLVFSLSRYEEKSYKEISEELGISIKTVENQISKALKELRNAFF